MGGRGRLLWRLVGAAVLFGVLAGLAASLVVLALTGPVDGIREYTREHCVVIWGRNC
ncbi:hypothetical protein [Streptomyces sp. BE303]|uniref:hypothetical protein n=1 Tax=Streptomycetaceae TaxID=2062 RepID=UPI002E7A67EC|nr:hypothetical protein [Streptomyces sp. BE303]MED7955181.1 hypothetical protein [Streptomyces sp. BE303]MEE1824952.1 hypothetical protein [Streptomyces sp. BE20]